LKSYIEWWIKLAGITAGSRKGAHHRDQGPAPQ
jgi:hypothetical protein